MCPNWWLVENVVGKDTQSAYRKGRTFPGAPRCMVGKVVIVRDASMKAYKKFEKVWEIFVETRMEARNSNERMKTETCLSAKPKLEQIKQFVAAEVFEDESQAVPMVH